MKTKNNGKSPGKEFGFHQLVDLCRVTHREMQTRAGCSVDIFLAVRNWMFGWHIVEYEQKGADRAKYGKELLAKLSAELNHQGIKGVSATNLKACRTFYRTYKEIGRTASDQLSDVQNIRQTASDEYNGFPVTGGKYRPLFSANIAGKLSLGWSHYVTLLTIENPEERRFYEIEASQNNWSVRELERQISSSLYERLALSRNTKDIRRLAERGHVVEKPGDIIKDPLVLEFLGLGQKPAYTEDELESAIIEKLERFLLELGKGFLFEARQKRFTFDNDNFYVDLVFYNRLLRCYVLIDLKRDKLTHQDLGQMQMYVNYFDRQVKTIGELPTIGILLCRRKNDALVELTLPKRANIFASKYQLYLPSKKLLREQLKRIEAELEGYDE